MTRRNERDQRIVDLYRKGLSTMAVAVQMDLSSSGVYYALKRMGEPLRPPGHPKGMPAHNKSSHNKSSRGRMAKLVSLYRRGLSLREVGRKLDISFQRVQQILAYVGEQRRSSNRPASFSGHRGSDKPVPACTDFNDADYER
jgi:transposase